jgi:hypothetical protein
MGQVSVCWNPGKDRETMTTGIMMSSNDTDIHATGIIDNIKTFNFLIILQFNPLSILQVQCFHSRLEEPYSDWKNIISLQRILSCKENK